VCKFCARRFYFSFTFVLTNNESGAQLSELRDLAHQNIGQLNRAMLDGSSSRERHSTPPKLTSRRFAITPASSRAQTKFVKSSMASMQKQSMDVMRAGKEVAE
jgi:hypothetical protein